MLMLNQNIQAEINRLFRGQNRQYAMQLMGIINDLDDYWPLTVRQTFYQAVAALFVENIKSQYQRTSKILATLRREDLLHWDTIEDRTRRTIEKRGISGLDDFLKNEVETLLNPQYYHRCYVGQQDVYCEVATEKDALSSILQDAVYWYCTRLNVVRGQVSASMVKNMADRFDRAIMRGQQPVLLYIGDFDPSGIAIPKALQRNLDEHHCIDLELKRIALNPDQIKTYRLPESFDAAKHEDPNYKAWLREYGSAAPVEVDALHPGDLKSIVETELQQVYNMDAYEVERVKEEQERLTLKRMRRETLGFLKDKYPHEFHFI